MKTKTALIIITIFTALSTAYAQEPALKEFLENGKYGFKNPQGEIIIKPTYDFVSKASDGMVLVQKKDKYGFVDAVTVHCTP